MITPSDHQNAVLRDIVDWYRNTDRQEYYLAGYAGTGKTTLAAFAVGELGLDRVMTGAYTGKAAHVLRRKGAPNPGTIHSMIYEPIPGSDPVEFTLATDPMLCHTDLLVLDECSMIPDDIANDLRRFARRILVLGDPAQLPPIRGAGAFTAETPDALLTEIHRQAADSPIIRLATAVREGKPLQTNLDRVARVLRSDAAYDLDRIDAESCQVLCGVHRVRWALTAKMRAARGFSGPLPCPSEPLICCRNNHEIGLYNGMLCTLLDEPEIDERDGTILIRVETETDSEITICSSTRLFREHAVGPLPVEPYRRGVESFDWAYALTVHKAQGSEWPEVYLLDDSCWFREDARRWLYTGITRAQDALTVRLR